MLIASVFRPEYGFNKKLQITDESKDLQVFTYQVCTYQVAAIRTRVFITSMYGDNEYNV